MHLKLLIVNGVHPVSDGTGGTLVWERPVTVGSCPTEPRCVVVRRSRNLSMGNCKLFGAILFLLAVGQKSLKC